MKIFFGIVRITRDRRNAAQLASARAIEQERADQALEQLWRQRVAANVSARLTQRVEEFLRIGK